MDLSFIHPVTQQTIAVTDTDLLVHQLSQLEGNHHVIFTGAPFPSEPAFVNRLVQLFHTEKLSERLTFEVEIPADALDEEACKRWRKLGLTHLTLPLSVGADLTPYKQIASLGQQYHLAVTWLLLSPETTVLEKDWAALYWFLHQSLGIAAFKATPDFEQHIYYKYFVPMIAASKGLTTMFQSEEQVMQQAYTFLYQWLSNHLPPNVKTILEINPFSQRQFYRQFLQQPFPWKITALDLPHHDLDQPALTKLGKTFDAIVLFHSLSCVPDPQKLLLMLQKYARPTTQWIVLSYNIRTIPTLIRLLANHWDNVFAFTPMFYWMKLSSQPGLKKFFEMLSVDLTIDPIKGPIDDAFQRLYDNIRPLIEGQPAQAEFEAHLNVQAYLASGMMTQQDESIETSGFISSGFLNSF